MSLIFFDGFDNIACSTSAMSKWDYCTAGVDWYSTGGRRNTGMIGMNSDSYYCTRAVAANDTYFLGFAMMNIGDISNDQNFVHFRDAGTDQITLRFSNYSAGTANVAAYRNGTLLGTSAEKVAVVDMWQYVEIKVVIHDTAGSVTVKYDGTIVLELTNQDTDAISSGQVTDVRLSGLDSDVRYDDCYCLDDNGSTNNNFLGDVKVVTLLPTGNGSYTEMTPLSGTNYENVDDTTTDYSTSYNTADAVSETDTFTVTTPTALATIYGLQVCAVAQNYDAGSRKIKNLIYKNTTAYLGANELTLSYNWQQLCQLWETDPVDSMQWNKAKIDAAQFGVKLTA